MYPIYVLLVSTSHKFHSVLLYDQLFWRYRPFETSALNNPKMTLNPTRSSVPHICITSIPESQISVLFTLWPAVAVLRQVRQMTLNDFEPYKVKSAPYMRYQYLRVPNFTLLRSMASRFWVTGHFEKSALNDPKMSLNPTRSNLPHI